MTSDPKALHESAIVIDGHCDALMAIADGKIRLGVRTEVPAEEGWKPPIGYPEDSLGGLYNFSPHTGYFQTIGFYDIPRLIEGGVTAQAFAIYLQDDELDRALQFGDGLLMAPHRREIEDAVGIVSVGGIRCQL